MKNWLAKFMYGRYGIDKYSNFLFILAFILMLSSMFLTGTIKAIFFYIAIFVFIFSYYRMFSRNTAKRYSENQKYLTVLQGIKNKFSLAKEHATQRKTYKFFSCPNCSQKVRVPKNKGKVKITCPKCKTTFEKTT